MKVFLASKVKKSVPKWVFRFGKSKLLGLVNFDFLDLAKFITVDKFLIFLLILPLLALPVAFGTS